MDYVKLFDRYNSHKLSKWCSRNVVVVYIQFSYTSALDYLYKLLCANIFYLVVLKL